MVEPNVGAVREPPLHETDSDKHIGMNEALSAYAFSATQQVKVRPPLIPVYL